MDSPDSSRQWYALQNPATNLFLGSSSYTGLYEAEYPSDVYAELSRAEEVRKAAEEMWVGNKYRIVRVTFQAEVMEDV